MPGLRTAVLLAMVALAWPAHGQLPMQCGTLVAGQFHILTPKASDDSYYNWWDFEGQAGQRVTIEMRSILFDAYLILLDPSGRPVAQNDDAEPQSSDARIMFTLTRTGTWQIIANSVVSGQVGDYKLTLQCSEAPPPPARRRAARP